jgi:hypothetical protein
MSEKIFAWLWQLYPRRFRDVYREDALQLVRDRARAEPGLTAGVRLWFDLIRDVAVSLPVEYLRPSSLAASSPAQIHGAPAFQVIENGSPRTSSLLAGAVLSLCMLMAFPLAIWRLRDHPVAIDSIVGLGIFEPQMVQERSNPQNRRAADDLSGVDAEERHRVIAKAVEYLNQFYADHAVAQQMGNALLDHEKNGDYAGTTDGGVFAKMLTQHLRDVSHDLHLEVVYSRRGLPPAANGPSPERREQYRKALEAESCTFANVERLPHNIGYFKLNSFPDLAFCEAAAKTAMASLNGADAVIFDLRDNRGGYPAMVMFMAAYLFDHPQYMYRPEAMPDQCMTKSPVPGSRLADKPVYVLTSSRTFSGAEHFSYDLKMLKRATLVGETTGGATDVAVFHRIDDHFGMGIRESKAGNPYSEPDWAVNGVQPNVKVNAADALAVSQELAWRAISHR